MASHSRGIGLEFEIQKDAIETTLPKCSIKVFSKTFIIIDMILP